MPVSALEQFSAGTREWFERAFAEPTPAQAQAWPAIASGEHVLISAPTGSGKTLAAFLWAIDTLAAGRAGGNARAQSGVSLVYVSPLKALSYDIDRNLRAPLRGIGADLSVGVRTGDTPQRERQAMLRKPARHPDHDARVAVPDADRACPGAVRRDPLVHRRRDPRRRRDQARIAPGADARAPRRGGGARPAADRPERDPEPARGGRPVHGRPARSCRIVDTGRPQAARPARSRCRSSRWSSPMRRPAADLDPLEGGTEATRRSIWPAIYPELLELGARAPLDDHLRQQPPQRRAAGAAAQRARGAATSPRERSHPPTPAARSLAPTTGRSLARSGRSSRSC